MKYPVYSIRDVKTGYLTPTVDQNDASAIRNFEHACMDPNTLFASHSEHYALYRIGEFDVETGTLIPCQPTHLCDATEVL